MSNAAGKDFARWRGRMLRDAEKEQNRARLDKLRADVRAARMTRDAAIDEVRAYCRSLRSTSRASNAACQARAADAAEAWAPPLDAAIEELASERKHQAEIREIEAGNRKRQARKPRASRKERQSESDDAVRANIPPELVPLFEKVKRSIKGSAHRSRTEEFLEYSEEHPEEVFDVEAIEDETERMIREHEAALRSGRRNPTSRLRYVLTAVDRGRVLGTLKTETVRGAIHEADQKFPGSHVMIRAAYTSDGTFWGEGHGRAMAWRDGKMPWIVEAWHDEPTESRRDHGEPWTSRKKTPNPSPAALTELGKLTRIAWKGGERRWSLAQAPILAYDKSGRLCIVYAPRPAGRASRAELREYARTHWGQEGKGARVVGAVFDDGPVRELGAGTSITYTTRKGSRELVDWVHAWGEGARGPWKPPIVVEHVCRLRSCGAVGTIALRGGSYRVTDRGIVG